MKGYQLLSAFILAWAVVLPAQAELRHYGAGLESAQWKLAQSNPLACKLEHDIPQFGMAVFEARAGQRSDVQFVLHPKRQMLKTSRASLVAEAPRWRPGVATQELGTVDIYPGYAPGSQDKKMAWTMLTELERGYQPTLYFDDGMSRYDTVSVSLSAVRFHKHYDEFAACVAGLLPYSFKDLELTVLHYEKNSNNLNRVSREQLQSLMTYLKYDNSVTAVLVDTFSDSYGGRWHNQQLSEKRGQRILDYMTKNGIPEDRIRMEAHGETRHVASNETASGREQNRRVVIRLVRGGPQV